MKSFKQALILCGGKAVRLRPYSYICSKAQLPFLNLPLLAYPWKLAEDLENSSFLLNSHLFPEELKKTAESLSKKNQKLETFFEKEPLSSVGTLLALKKKLKKAPYFTYINGDCLLFPSSPKRLKKFEQEFLNSKASALLFVIPAKQSSSHHNFVYDRSGRLAQAPQKRVLFCDSQQNLREVRLPQPTDKPAYFFTGLALFQSALLDELKAGAKDLFSDFLKPLLAEKKIKVFIDEEAFFLEAGDKNSYLKSTEFCLKSLYTDIFPLICPSFESPPSALKNSDTKIKQTGEQEFFREKTGFVKKRLEEIFQRFDPQDKKAGLKNSSVWSKKLKAFCLIPPSAQGLDLLKAEGFSVIAPQVRFYNKAQVKNSVLACPRSSLQGSLKEELLLS